MSMSPPSPDGSTGMTIFTFGSALTDTSLTAPVVRSATSADLLSGCIEQAAGAFQAALHHPWCRALFGKWLVRQRWRRGRRRARRWMAFGLGGERLDAASLNCAQPARTSSVEQSAVTTPPRPPRLHGSQITDISARCPRRGGARLPYLPANGRVRRHANRHSESAAQSPIRAELPLP